jgi:hypothetical protein
VVYAGRAGAGGGVVDYGVYSGLECDMKTYRVAGNAYGTKDRIVVKATIIETVRALGPIAAAVRALIVYGNIHGWSGAKWLGKPEVTEMPEDGKNARYS